MVEITIGGYTTGGPVIGAESGPGSRPAEQGGDGQPDEVRLRPARPGNGPAEGDGERGTAGLGDRVRPRHGRRPVTGPAAIARVTRRDATPRRRVNPAAA